MSVSIKTLECSSKGDKRFSAFYAIVEAFGIYQSIEKHYQQSKRDVSGNHVKKGNSVAYMVINGYQLPAEYLTDWYNLLWVKYLDKNPQLAAYARRFDEFTDIFRGKSINCQADVIKEYVSDRDKLLRSIRITFKGGMPYVCKKLSLHY